MGLFLIREVPVDARFHPIWIPTQLLYDRKANVEGALDFLQLHLVREGPRVWRCSDLAVHPFPSPHAQRSENSRVEQTTRPS